MTGPYRPAAAAEHEIVDLLADVHGYRSEQRAAAHWEVDHPPTVGSPEWIQHLAELHILIDDAERENERQYREICAQGGPS